MAAPHGREQPPNDLEARGPCPRAFPAKRCTSPQRALAPVQERELDDEAAADDFAAESLDKLLADRLYRPAGGEDVVVNQDARSLRDHVRMELERVLSVLERVGRADRLRGKLPRPARRDEAAADLPGDRGPEDEAARFGAEDEIGLLRAPPLRELLDRVRERIRVGEQRRDVLEADARLRPVGDLADLFGEIHPIMLTQAGAARARRGAARARRRAH